MLRNIGELLTEKTFFNLGRFNNNSVALLKTLIMTKTKNVNFIIVKPWDLDAAKAAITNAKNQGKKVIGFEVTHPAIKPLLGYNFNLQHEEDGNASISAIKEVKSLWFDHPAYVYGDEENYIAVFEKLDIDAISASIWYRNEIPRLKYAWDCDPNVPMQFYSCQADKEAMERLDLIHRYDTFANGAAANLDEAYNRVKPLGGIIAACNDCKETSRTGNLSMEELVKIISDWMYHGTEPAKYQKEFEEQFETFRKGIEKGEVKMEVAEGLCVMESNFELGNLALQFGYTFARVVCSRLIDQNKIAICQPTPGNADIISIGNELTKLDGMEPGKGWGGPKGMMAMSPRQGTKLNFWEQIVPTVKKHIIS